MRVQSVSAGTVFCSRRHFSGFPIIAANHWGCPLFGGVRYQGGHAGPPFVDFLEYFFLEYFFRAFLEFASHLLLFDCLDDRAGFVGWLKTPNACMGFMPI
ncbi:hypothetical protein B2D07_13925 [Desulfococcus multivorans]|nr:hypothetical protein B2D07_13925 [Desulfococcus multivorans]